MNLQVSNNKVSVGGQYLLWRYDASLVREAARTGDRSARYYQFHLAGSLL